MGLNNVSLPHGTELCKTLLMGLIYAEICINDVTLSLFMGGFYANANWEALN